MKRIVLLAAVLYIFGVSCQTEADSTVSSPLRPVRAEPVVRAGEVNRVSLSGVAQSSKEAQLSFRVSGTLRSLRVKVGDRVERGTLIASLDPTDYQVSYQQAVAQLRASETQIESAEAQLVNARSTLQRVEALYENNSVPLSEYEQAKSAYDQAQAQYTSAQASVEAAEQQVASAKNQVQYATLMAPFAGIITEIKAEENELVGSGNPVATLSAQRSPEVRVGVPESMINAVQQGEQAIVRFSSLPGQRYKGRITEVGYSPGQSSTYPVTVVIDNPDEGLRPGMAATVSLPQPSAMDVEEGAYLLLPSAAIGEDDAGNYVFQLQSADSSGVYMIRKTRVEIGPLRPNGYQLKGGLKEGDLVATAGLKSILDGMRVRLMQEQ